MTKTAICISGELRSIDTCFPKLQTNVLDTLADYDIYYFGWTDDPNIDKLSILEKHPNIKDIAIESRKKFNIDYYYPIKQPNIQYLNILRQFYCLQAVNNLKNSHNISYDINIRVRPDLYIRNKLQEDLYECDMNKLWLLDHDNWHGYSDRLYISNTPIMDIVSNRIDNIREYNLLGAIAEYEGFLQFVCNCHDVEVDRLSLKTHLLRTNGDTEGELVALERGEIELRPRGIYHIAQNAYI